MKKKIILLSLLCVSVVGLCLTTSFAALWGQDLNRDQNKFLDQGFEVANQSNTFPSNYRTYVEEAALQATDAQDFLRILTEEKNLKVDPTGNTVLIPENKYKNAYNALVKSVNIVSGNSIAIPSTICEIVYKAYTESNFQYKVLEMLMNYEGQEESSGYVFYWNPTIYQGTPDSGGNVYMDPDFVGTRGCYFPQTNAQGLPKNYLNDTSLFNILMFGNLLPESAYAFDSIAAQEPVSSTSTLKGLGTILKEDPGYLEDVSLILCSNHYSGGSNVVDNTILNAVKTYVNAHKPIFFAGAAEIGQATVKAIRDYSLHGASPYNTYIIYGVDGQYTNIGGTNQLVRATGVYTDSGAGHLYILMQNSTYATPRKNFEMVSKDVSGKLTNHKYLNSNSPFYVSLNLPGVGESLDAWLDTCDGKYKYEMVYMREQADVPFGISEPTGYQLSDPVTEDVRLGSARGKARVQKLSLKKGDGVFLSNVILRVIPDTGFQYETNDGSGRDDGSMDELKIWNLQVNGAYRNNVVPMSVEIETVSPLISLQVQTDNTVTSGANKKFVGMVTDLIGAETRRDVEPSGMIYSALVAFENGYSADFQINKIQDAIKPDPDTGDYIKKLQDELMARKSVVLWEDNRSNAATKPTGMSFRSIDWSSVVGKTIGEAVYDANQTELYFMTVDWAGNVKLKLYIDSFDLLDYL